MKKSRHAQSTLPHTLGELELCVMASVWQVPGIDAKQILEKISVHHPSSLSAIQSTLERLVRKGLLEREKQGHAFIYNAHVSRAELLGLLLKDVIRRLHDGSPDTILSSFVNVASRGARAGWNPACPPWRKGTSSRTCCHTTNASFSPWVG